MVGGEPIVVTKWRRARDAILFRLSNGSIQVNFHADRSKVVIIPRDRTVRYFGSDGAVAGRETWTVRDGPVVPPARAANEGMEGVSRIRFAGRFIRKLVQERAIVNGGSPGA